MDRCVTLQSAAASPRDSVTIGHSRHAPTGPDTWSEKYSICIHVLSRKYSNLPKFSDDASQKLKSSTLT
jgi:hypothetical protein